jgi:hypothetical protein
MSQLGAGRRSGTHPWVEGPPTSRPSVSTGFRGEEHAGYPDLSAHHRSRHGGEPLVGIAMLAVVLGLNAWAIVASIRDAAVSRVRRRHIAPACLLYRQ